MSLAYELYAYFLFTAFRSLARTLGNSRVLISSNATKKEDRTKSVLFFCGAEGGIRAFSGAPRSAIINGVLCLLFLLLYLLTLAKHFAPAKWLPPSNPSLKSVTLQKKRTEQSLSSFFVAQKEGFEPSLRFSHTTPLAGEPLEPLGYFCKLSDVNVLFKSYTTITHFFLLVKAFCKEKQKNFGIFSQKIIIKYLTALF